jgi:DNA polymerase-4
MYQLGIFKGNDLKEKSKDFLIKHFKNSGAHYYQLVRGLYQSEVRPNRIQKSVATEHTFNKNLTSEIFMMDRLEAIAEELESRLQKSKIAGKTITLKIKYSDFTLQTRSKTLPFFVKDKNILLETVKELLFQKKVKESVRLLGISVSNLNNTSDKDEKVMDIQLRFEF